MTAQPAAPQQQIWDNDLIIPGHSQLTNGMTIFGFGPIGTWKTTVAGQFPSPVFLSAGQEGGDDTLAMLPQIYGINPPPVYRIDSPMKMSKKVEYIARNYERYGWKTVVIDSISMYVDIYIRDVLTRQMQRGVKTPQMAPRDWGFLEAHVVKELAQTLHATKLNVIWLALAKEKWSPADKQGERQLDGYEPMMGGTARIKLPAICKMVVFAGKEMRPAPGGGMMSVPVWHTAPTMMVKDVRHKYGNAFPSGRVQDPNYNNLPTFNAFAQEVGQFIYQ